MAKKQGKQNHKRMVISLRHVATPDAEERLARAIGILLKAAARDTTKSVDSINTEKETSPSCQAPAEDVPTGGAKEDDSHASE